MSTKVKRLTRAEQRATNRAALIDAAMEVVVEVGYDAMQLEDVAARAGLTKGAVYSIFGSKLDLLVSVIEQLASTYVPVVEGLARMRSTASVEVVLARAYADAHRILRDPATSQQLRLEADLVGLAVRHDAVREALAPINAGLIEGLEDALAGRLNRNGRMLTQRELSELCRAVYSLIRGLTVSQLLDGWSPQRATILAALEGLVPA